ncbi:unnamed protein product [Paramecium primaurelia]|uniref:Uncharacterized protein n=1 Tax=Paramecium primaurelia TaxID=5886 RepID=A0A8S1KVP6_PARPR|nr:unnamed protein product [Paramecium primaurelia]
MQNRPSSKHRYQQMSTMDSINLKEKQLYQSNSSVQLSQGAILRPDQISNQQQYGYSQIDKKIAQQAVSYNPITGAPQIRNPINYPIETQLQKNTPYGIQLHFNNYTTTAGQIGSGTKPNDTQFEKNLNKFFAADDPNQVQSQSHLKSNDAQPLSSNPQFQKNLVKFFAADDPFQPKRKNNLRQSNSRSINQYSQQFNSQYQEQLLNNQQFKKNLTKFFAADDPTQIKKHHSQNNNPNPSQQRYQPLNDPLLDSRQVYYQNSNKNFAGDDPSQQKIQISQQSQQQQQINSIEQNILQRLEQDPRFQKNLQQFFGIDAEFQQNQNIQQTRNQYTRRQENIKQSRIITITDSSAAARNQVVGFFKARGVDDFDQFAIPGGVFGLINNPVQENSLIYYINTMRGAYHIKEIYIISVLDQNSNVKIYTTSNDKRLHQNAIYELKSLLENKHNIREKFHGIIIDQRGSSEKVF